MRQSFVSESPGQEGWPLESARRVSLVAFLLLGSALAGAHETAFDKTIEVYLDQGQVKEREVSFVIEDFSLIVRHRDSREAFHSIHLARIVKLKYELATRPEALSAAPSSWPSGDPEQKRPWLTIHYQEGGKPAVVLLVLDPGESQKVIRTIREELEKEVEGAPPQ